MLGHHLVNQTEEAAARTYQVSVQLLKYRLNVTGVNFQFRRARAGRGR
jgi:hypothetical protein